MTLDECYNANVGKMLLIPGGGAGNEGQCVQWADTVLHDVYNQPYHWGNAIDWWRNPGELTNHFDLITDGSIKKGDFVIFNEKVGSIYGHIDVAMQDGTTQSFQGADSNWGGSKTVHLVQHTGSQYVLGSIRLKGDEMTKPTPEQVSAAFQKHLGHDPTQADIDYYISNDISILYANLLDSQTSKIAELNMTFNEGDAINFNNYFYGKDNGQFRDLIGKDWKAASYAIEEQLKASQHLLVNDGDIPNLTNAGIENAAPASGLDWKTAVYSVILPNVPKPTPVPGTVITPDPQPTPDSVTITKDSLWARFIKFWIKGA